MDGKKIVQIVITLLFIGVVAVIFISISKKEMPVTIVKGNMEHKPLAIKLDATNDTQCKMLIRTERNSAEVVSPDGRTWFFDDPGCMVLWLQEREWADRAFLWVHTIDTGRWVDARKAWYGVTDHTAMHYGFGAREKKCEGCIDFTEMRSRMLRGETLVDPKIRKKLLGV
jgi:hypothetical protein